MAELHPENLKPFVKGDKRINRKGRPKSFDALRSITIDMFSRQAKDSNGTPIFIEGRPVTMVEFVVWKMIRSKDPREVQYALQLAFGKVPDNIDITSGGKPLSWAAFIQGTNDDDDTAAGG